MDEFEDVAAPLVGDEAEQYLAWQEVDRLLANGAESARIFAISMRRVAESFQRFAAAWEKANEPEAPDKGSANG